MLNRIKHWFINFGKPKQVSGCTAAQYLLADAEHYAKIGHADISRQLLRVAQDKIEKESFNY